MGNMFDLDDNLLKEDKKETKDYSELLKKANIFCMRELFDKALAIYNEILEEDMENEEAYIGLLKVHSAYFTKYDGDEIEKDIRIIERMFPDTVNEEYAKYCLERKKALANKKPEPKPEPKVEAKEEKKEEPKKVVEPKKEEKKPASNFVFNKDIQKAMHHLDKSMGKKALDITGPLIRSGTDDIYVYFAFGYGNYLKNRYQDAKKYLELFLSKADKTNPFYLNALLALGWSYSGINGRVPDIDKAIEYYSKAYDFEKSPYIYARLTLLKETKKCPDLFKYTWYQGSFDLVGTGFVYKENVAYAKKLIAQGIAAGYAIYAMFDGTLSKETRNKYFNNYFHDPDTNQKSMLYFRAWNSYYDLNDKKLFVPPYIREAEAYKSPNNSTFEQKYLSLKRG